MSEFETIAQLRQLLFGLEKDLGLDRLGGVQRNIIYASTLLSQHSQILATDDIRQHELLEDVPRSTFFKALKEVVSAGYLVHVDGAQRSHYLLTSKQDEPK